MDTKQYRKAVFLDRDGVINADVYYERWGEWEAPMSPEDVRLLPGVAEGLSKLQRAGYLLFIVSNQGACAKGKTDLESLVATGKHVEELLAAEGIEIVKAYYAYSHPRGTVEGFSMASPERKPSPYFLRVAATAYDIALSQSWMIGDRESDILCGRAAGCRTCRVFNPHADISGALVPDFEAQTLLEASELILRNPSEEAG